MLGRYCALSPTAVSFSLKKFRLLFASEDLFFFFFLFLFRCTNLYCTTFYPHLPLVSVTLPFFRYKVPIRARECTGLSSFADDGQQ